VSFESGCSGARGAARARQRFHGVSGGARVQVTNGGAIEQERWAGERVDSCGAPTLHPGEQGGVEESPASSTRPDPSAAPLLKNSHPYLLP
jgi:hypothetical protein